MALKYFNYFVGGSEAWNAEDVTSIDAALEASMKDEHLNNVMAQYYAEPITTEFLGHALLAGSEPKVVSQGDIENLVRRFDQEGTLAGIDLASTVLNFMLPSGTILNTDSAPTGGTIGSRLEGGPAGRGAVPHEEEDSTQGLGGYHGSIHADGKTVYYAVGVFSELWPDGTENGIVVFDRPWKNVVATFYHELNEARTDPDVEDAIRAGDDPDAVRFLGWTSPQGEECGDFPVFEANPLSLVFQEVDLAIGAGRVPVQFQYSNAVHGPEGPIARAHASAVV